MFFYVIREIYENSINNEKGSTMGMIVYISELKKVIIVFCCEMFSSEKLFSARCYTCSLCYKPTNRQVWGEGKTLLEV